MKVSKDAANQFAANVAPIITSCQKAGVTNLQGIADLECPWRLDGPEAPVISEELAAALRSVSGARQARKAVQ